MYENNLSWFTEKRKYCNRFLRMYVQVIIDRWEKFTGEKVEKIDA